jgi:YVTN family beta-propeller protein
MRAKVLSVSCLAIAVTTASVAGAKPLLFVSAEGSGEVAVVDPAKAEVVAQIPVGPRPRGLKLARDRKRLLVALAGAAKSPAGPAPFAAAAMSMTAGLAVVDVAARKVVKQVATPPAPFAVDLLPDGRTAYLSNAATNELVVIDVADGAVKAKIPVGTDPQGVAVRPDGKVVYLATHGADEVSAIDPKAGKLLGRIDAGSRPQTVLYAPRGDTAFVIDEGNPIVTIVDAKQNMFKAQFVLQGLPKTPAPALQSAVLSRDGKLLYVTTGPGKSVLIVDPAKKAVVGTIEDVGAFPRGIAISADGKKLYTANGGSNDVAIIDVASKKVTGRIAVSGAPWGLALRP